MRGDEIGSLKNLPSLVRDKQLIENNILNYSKKKQKKIVVERNF